MSEADERVCSCCGRSCILTNYTLDFACECGEILRPKFAEKEEA